MSQIHFCCRKMFKMHFFVSSSKQKMSNWLKSKVQTELWLTLFQLKIKYFWQKQDVWKQTGEDRNLKLDLKKTDANDWKLGTDWNVRKHLKNVASSWQTTHLLFYCFTSVQHWWSFLKPQHLNSMKRRRSWCVNWCEIQFQFHRLGQIKPGSGNSLKRIKEVIRKSCENKHRTEMHRGSLKFDMMKHFLAQSPNVWTRWQEVVCQRSYCNTHTHLKQPVFSPQSAQKPLLPPAKTLRYKKKHTKSPPAPEHVRDKNKVCLDRPGLNGD